MDLNNLFSQYNDEKKLSKEILDKIKEKIEVLTDEIKTSYDQQSLSTIYLGSYKTNTCVEYKDKAYDIDLGLRLNIKESELYKTDASQVKSDIFNAIYEIREKKIKKPCITVVYYKEDKPQYHIDIPVYAYDDQTDTYYHAQGDLDDCKWIKCEPGKLIEFLSKANSSNIINDHYRMTIRFLKLWKSKVFSSLSKKSCPPSIAINITARNVFANYTSTQDFIEYLLDVVNKLKKQINYHQVSLTNPYLPYNDIFYKMNEKTESIREYNNKIDELIEGLNEVKQVTSLEEKAKILKRYFPDFPLPEKEKVDKSVNPSGTYGITF